MALVRDRCAAVGQGDGVEALLIRRTHRGLDATVCQEARDHDRLDAVRNEQLLKVRAWEGVQALLVLYNEVTLDRGHWLADLSTPGARGEEPAVRAAMEDSQPLVGVIRVVRGKRDGDEHDFGPLFPRCGHHLGGLIQHASVLHASFDRIVHLASLGRELILVLNQNQRRLLWVDCFEPALRLGGSKHPIAFGAGGTPTEDGPDGDGRAGKAANHTRGLHHNC
mmetsp:Transcript_25582/g.57381  ORF Transcript_25582/g.57381 Transcript_25582/m.57381 type:complete len:223 (-) Transcript_25582:66-734(-)